MSCNASEDGFVISKLKPSVNTNTIVFLLVSRFSNAFAVNVNAAPVAVTPPWNGNSKIFLLQRVIFTVYIYFLQFLKILLWLEFDQVQL